jgi:hypothetical protein
LCPWWIGRPARFAERWRYMNCSTVGHDRSSVKANVCDSLDTYHPTRVGTIDRVSIPARNALTARLNRLLKKRTADLSTPLRSGRDDKLVAFGRDWWSGWRTAGPSTPPCQQNLKAVDKFVVSTGAKRSGETCGSLLPPNQPTWIAARPLGRRRRPEWQAAPRPE